MDETPAPPDRLADFELRLRRLEAVNSPALRDSLVSGAFARLGLAPTSVDDWLRALPDVE